MFSQVAAVRDALQAVYPPAVAARLLCDIADVVRSARPTNRRKIGEGALLLAYPSNIVRPETPGLRTLTELIRDNFSDVFAAIHVLPPYESSSDFGFAPINHTKISAEHGEWQDLAGLAKVAPVVLDLVVNHTSADHMWFKQFAAGRDEYDHFYIECDPSAPPAGHARSGRKGIAYLPQGSAVSAVLARYSPDQPDLNYQNPKVLRAMCEVAARVAEQPVSGFRVDAIAYTWKKAACVQPHSASAQQLLKVFTGVVQGIASDALVIPEVDIDAHGALYVDAPGVRGYSYATAPLLVYAALSGDAAPLRRFLSSSIRDPLSAQSIRFISTHDGLMLRSYAPVLSNDQCEYLADAAIRAGGHVSRSEAGCVYELNIPIVTLLGGPNGLGNQRLLASIFAMISMPGTPAIYMNTLLGVSLSGEAVADARDPRAINRQTICWDTAATLLHGRGDFLQSCLAMLRMRKSEPCLKSDSRAELVPGSNAGMLIVRRAIGPRCLFAAVNFGTSAQALPRECLDGTQVLFGCSAPVLGPLQFCWLVKEENA
jgi:glycosidase